MSNKNKNTQPQCMFLMYLIHYKKSASEIATDFEEYRKRNNKPEQSNRASAYGLMMERLSLNITREKSKNGSKILNSINLKQIVGNLFPEVGDDLIESPLGKIYESILGDIRRVAPKILHENANQDYKNPVLKSIEGLKSIRKLSRLTIKLYILVLLSEIINYYEDGIEPHYLIDIRDYPETFELNISPERIEKIYKLAYFRLEYNLKNKLTPMSFKKRGLVYKPFREFSSLKKYKWLQERKKRFLSISSEAH